MFAFHIRIVASGCVAKLLLIDLLHLYFLFSISAGLVQDDILLGGESNLCVLVLLEFSYRFFILCP